jgi:hypothetical protein
MTGMTSTARPLLNRRLAEFGTTIFAEMSALALKTGSINLGQGFPDTDGPEEIREAAVRALRDGRGNQYPPGPGVPELRTAIAAHQERRYGLSYDPDAEVLVTAGATEAIAAPCSPWSNPATRSSPWSRTTTPTRLHRDGGRHPRTGHPAPARGSRSASTSTSCAPPSPTAPASS